MQMFKDKTVIVTGAARGIGRGIATHLAQQGAQLILVDCDQEGLEESSKIISGATTFCGDVTDQAFVNKVVASCSQVDVLINNAGVTRDNLVAKISENDWDQVMAVNLKGPFLFSQAVLPLMKESQKGKIVNIISASWLGNIGQANYSASKGGLVSFTRTTALEFARYNINVNGVSPGLIETEMVKSIPEKVKERLINMRPLKRVGKIEEIADAVAFLASDRSDYITGQILHVDGGKSCGILAL